MLAEQRPMEQSLKEKRSATQGPVYSRRFVMNHGEFAEAPEKNVLLQKIWSLRPNAVLMNTGYTNYMLYHLAGRLFLNYQAAPVVYVVVMIATLIIGRWKYGRLQVGK